MGIEQRDRRTAREVLKAIYVNTADRVPASHKRFARRPMPDLLDYREQTAEYLERTTVDRNAVWQEDAESSRSQLAELYGKAVGLLVVANVRRALRPSERMPTRRFRPRAQEAHDRAVAKRRSEAILANLESRKSMLFGRVAIEALDQVKNPSRLSRFVSQVSGDPDVLGGDGETREALLAEAFSAFTSTMEAAAQSTAQRSTTELSFLDDVPVLFRRCMRTSCMKQAETHLQELEEVIVARCQAVVDALGVSRGRIAYAFGLDGLLHGQPTPLEAGQVESLLHHWTKQPDAGLSHLIERDPLAGGDAGGLRLQLEDLTDQYWQPRAGSPSDGLNAAG